MKLSLNLCIIGFIALTACSKDEGICFASRGEQFSEIRLLPEFSGLFVDNRMDVLLTQDTANYIEVLYGENALSGIETTVENDILYIKDNNKCGWMREARPLPAVIIHYTTLKHIDSRNAGTMAFLEAFTGDSLRIEVEDASGEIEVKANCTSLELVVHTGATDIRMAGNADYVYIYNSGYAPIEAAELIAHTASVHNNSTGDTYVYATNILYYQIYHQGNVVLNGPATTTKWHQSGGGILVKASDQD